MKYLATMKNLIRAIVALSIGLFLTGISHAQSIVDLKLYDNVYTYGKECGLTANKIKNIKKYTSPAPYIKLISDDELVPNVEEIYLYFADGYKVELQYCPSYQNEYEYLLPISHREEYVNRLKSEPVVRVELIERVLDINVVHYVVLSNSTLKDSEIFIKYFEKND